MNISLGFDILAMLLSTAAAIFHSIHIYECRKLKDKDKNSTCNSDKRPIGKILVTLSLICVAMGSVINMLIPEKIEDAHTHHLVKNIHIWAILLPVTIAEFFILDNL